MVGAGAGGADEQFPATIRKDHSGRCLCLVHFNNLRGNVTCMETRFHLQFDPTSVLCLCFLDVILRISWIREHSCITGKKVSCSSIHCYKLYLDQVHPCKNSLCE